MPFAGSLWGHVHGEHDELGSGGYGNVSSIFLRYPSYVPGYVILQYSCGTQTN